MPDEGTAFVVTLVDFAHELRTSGLVVGSDDVMGYCAAVSVLNPGDLLDLYWSGRASLVTRHDQIPTYDRIFREFFLGDEGPPDPAAPFSIKTKEEAQSALQVPKTESEESDREEEAAELGLAASNAATLRTRSFGACTPDELAALRRISTTFRLTPPRRRTRRTMRASRGRALDLRRTVRDSLRMHGDPSQLLWKRRKLRLRPLILILDVSGSMADYSRSLLQFAYSTKRGATSRTEVFCFGTRLTRITRELDHRRPDEALERAAQTVFDWEGGTRIGDALDTFVRKWASRGMARGGIVVICSDGLDRGDPDVLAKAMSRLSRLCHRIVWMNPHKGNNTDFQPNTLGMMVAEPFIDLVLSGHDLRSLEEFAALLPDLR